MKKSITLNGKGKQDRIKTIALDLFYSNGYEKTSIQMIIDAVGISKGAFYHYFSAKDDIIESIASTYIEELLKITTEVSNDIKLSAIEKLNKLLLNVQHYRLEKLESMKKLFLLMNGESNLLFRERMLEKTVKNIVPEYKKILQQGINEGSIHTDYPHECAELIIRWGSFYRTKIFELIISDRTEKNTNEIFHLSAFVQDLIERLLGLKNGEFEVAKAYLLFFKSNNFNN